MAETIGLACCGAYDDFRDAAGVVNIEMMKSAMANTYSAQARPGFPIAARISGQGQSHMGASPLFLSPMGRGRGPLRSNGKVRAANSFRSFLNCYAPHPHRR